MALFQTSSPQPRRRARPWRRSIARSALAAALAAAALAGCQRATAPAVAPAAPALALGCGPVEGVEALLGATASAILLVGGSGQPARSVWAALVCHAAARGETVIAAVDPRVLGSAQAAVADPLPEAAAWRASGAAVSLTALAAGEEPADAGAQDHAAMAARLQALAGGGERLIVLVSEDAASRRPVGLAGQTWRPLGALLSPDAVFSLKAEPVLAPPARVTLQPIEDIPVRGAARSYDGVADAPASGA